MKNTEMSGNQQLRDKIREAREVLREAESLLSDPSDTATPSPEEGSGDQEGNPTGIFDGQFLVTEDGKKYQVPPNYASKSRLVVGDQLELVNRATDKEGSQNLVKPITKVDRTELEGILTKKDHQWAVVTDAGEFWVLSASVEYYDGEIGDQVKIILPADYQDREDLEWAAVDAIVKDDGKGLSGEIVLEEEAQNSAEVNAPRPPKAEPLGDAGGEKRGKDLPNPMDADVEELR